MDAPASSSEVASDSTVRIDVPERRATRRWPYIVLPVLLALGAGAMGLDDRDGDSSSPAGSPRPEVPTIQGGRITYGADFVARAGLAFAPVEPRSVLSVVDVTGAVTFDPRRVAAVGTRIPCRVTDIRVVEGDRVTNGDVLARFESADLGGAQADVMSLEARVAAAERDVERKTLLVEEGIASRGSAQQVEAEHASLRAELEAARQRVRALGGRAAKRGLGRFALAAPIGGEVVGVHVQRGESVEPSHTAFHVADLATVWVELALFERDLGRVAIGDPVDLQPRGGAPLRGRVARIGRVLDAGTRAAPARVEVDNPSRELAIGQSVRARIHVATGAVDGPAVPKDAVVIVDGRPTVFVAVGPRTVELREVEIAAEGEAFVAVARGLAIGEQLLVAGVFALKSELFR